MKRFGFALAVLFAASTLCAQVPQIINYQGRVLSGASNFNGTGQFKFALVNAAGTTTFWSNDNSSINGTEPLTAVSIPVGNGLYSVLLGDITIANMTNAIPNSVFSNSDVRLRVWFNDGTHGSQLLSPDQRIAAVGYAVMAASAASAPASGITGTLGVSNGGTGSTAPGGALTNLGAAATSSTLAQFALTTSAQLASVLSNETGSGLVVFGTSPNIVSPTISGTISAAAGGAAAPPYSFINDTNTGMFSNAIDTINFTTGGVLRMTIGSTGTVSVGAMTVLGTANINAMGTAATDIGNSTGGLTFSGAETHNDLITATGGIKVGSTGDTISFVKNVTSTLDFPNTAANSASDQTIAVTGAQVGDAVSLGVPNGAVVVGGQYSSWVLSANTVTVRFFNGQSVALNPPSASFRVVVTR